MIITITGDAGSGKSTVGKKIVEALSFKNFYSIGQIRRDLAKEMEMTLAEYNKYGETHPETDLDIDNYQKKLGEKSDNFLIDGRTSWFLIPNSIKLYFKVDPNEGASRIFKELQKNDARNEDNNLMSVEDIIESNKRRRESDIYRYKKYYGKDCFNEVNFDFVIDTTNLTAEEVFEKTMEYINSKK